MTVLTTPSPTGLVAPRTAPVALLGSEAFRLAAVDLYRDVHKGIRGELFAVTGTAGNLSPTDAADRFALAEHVRSVAAVLASHAEHEDSVIEPVLRDHLPELAERIAADHDRIEERIDTIVALAAASAIAPPADQRRLTHLVYLELAEFTGAYLAHQDLEERVVMPALEDVIGPEGTLDLHVAIVSNIPPDEMARFLAFMLPAMNVEDRTELLGGIRASAPPEAFEGILGLARSVLSPIEFVMVENRLGVAR
jgi:hypothetical protein